MLTSSVNVRFKLRSLFSSPVVAVIAGLLLVFLGVNKFIPVFVLKPLRLIGDCTLPLALLVVGGNLAQIRLEHIQKRAVMLMVLGKLVLLPALTLLLNYC